MPDKKKQRAKELPPERVSNNDAVRSEEIKVDLFVRVKPHIKDWLDEYSKTSKRSLSEIVEKLIAYFRYQDEMQRQDILGLQVIHNFSKLVQRLEWANHAFYKGFWPWALEEYQKVEELGQKLNAGGIRLHSRYKQAYCWLDIGIQWEETAIRVRNVNLFERARTAILNALFLNQRHLTEYSHKVIIFNIACAWSLLARISVEEELIKADVQSWKLLSEQAMWEKIGKLWRKKVNDQAFERRIDGYAEKAMSSLKKMVIERLIPFDHSYLLNRWQGDADLVFLRTDYKFSDDFSKFMKSSLDAVDVGQAFLRLCEGISDADREGVHQWSFALSDSRQH